MPAAHQQRVSVRASRNLIIPSGTKRFASRKIVELAETVESLICRGVGLHKKLEVVIAAHRSGNRLPCSRCDVVDCLKDIADAGRTTERYRYPICGRLDVFNPQAGLESHRQ